MIDFAFRAVLVYAVHSYLVFALGLAGLCTPPWMGASLAIPVAGAWFLRQGIAWGPGWARDHRLFLILLPLIGLAYSHAFWIPPFVRDDMIYHLLVPKQMAMAGRLAFDPYNLNANFPLLFEMPLAVLETLKLPVSPFILNFGFGLLLLSVFYAGLSAVAGLSRPAAVAAVAAFASTPVLVDLLHTGYVEIFLSVLVSLAALFYFRHLDGTGDGKDWWRACACLGLSAAVKYPGVIFSLIFFSFEFFRRTERKRFYAGVLLCAAIASPWYIKNWIWAGNPVFPFLNVLFGSPWISPTRFEGFRHMLSDYHMGRGILDYALLPFRLAFGSDRAGPPGPLGFDGKLSLFFLLPLLGLGWKEKTRFFASFLFSAYFAIWAWESQQARFLLPILPMAAIFGLRRMTRLPHADLWIGLGAAMVLAQNAINVAEKMRKDGIGRLLSAKIDRESFLASQLPISYGLAREINRRLDPAKHKLMTVGTFGRNYYFEIPALSNTFYEQETFRKYFERGRPEPDSVSAFLKENGITHILFHWDFVREMHARDTGFALEALEGYFRSVSRVAYQDRNLVLYERSY